MKRWLVRILLCLILGAITTVAVAWGAAAFHDARQGISEYGVSEVNDVLFYCWRRDRTALTYLSFTFAPAPDENGDPQIQLPMNRIVIPSWSHSWKFYSRSEEPHTRTLSEIAAGWPALGMVGSYSYPTWGGLKLVFENAIEWPTRFERVYEVRLLPLRPIWPGFVIDTLFYAAIWCGVIFGFTSAKRLIRAKRGRCPRCGYDLRGALATGCSECGWNREPTVS